jgi:hypothetical protein
MMSSYRNGRLGDWVLDQSQNWPAQIEGNSPPQAAGDGPENHRYSSVAPPVEPEDVGVVPPLVLRARQMGLDV